MFKLTRFGVALALGLVLAITLLVPGAFAQRANESHPGAVSSANHVAATTVFHQRLSANWGGWGWGRGWGWGPGWGGWGGGWGGWGGWGGGWGGWGGGWGGWGGCGCGWGCC